VSFITPCEKKGIPFLLEKREAGIRGKSRSSLVGGGREKKSFGAPKETKKGMLRVVGGTKRKGKPHPFFHKSRRDVYVGNP